MPKRMLLERRATRLLLPALFMAVAASGFGLDAVPARADVGDFAYSCGYWMNATIFGSPQGTEGCGVQTSQRATANTAGPSATDLGTNTPNSTVQSGGAMGVYGPAVMFSSPYLAPNDTLSNSGPLEVYTSTSPGNTAMTARAKATGVGPSPFWTQTPAATPPIGQPAASATYDGTVGYVEATCSASPSGKSGGTTIKNGRVDTATDSQGYPTATVVLPDNPAPNYRVNFTLNNVGDHGHLVFNEQTVNPDGSLTLNGSHMYMEGPNATGDVIIAQVVCRRIV